jgi:hypothetical protein
VYFHRWGDKQAIAVANVPSPADEAAHYGATPAADELIRRINKIAGRQRAGMAPQQV